jgi:hypothetical protein
MKIFWWQAGVHIEPETDEERAALLLLCRGLRYEEPQPPHIWVALSGDKGRILAQGGAFDEVVRQAEAVAPGEDPILTRVQANGDNS